MWYTNWGFSENPYGIKPPEFLSYEKIIWNRDDIVDKPNLEYFIQDIVDGRSVSLRIYGPTRSGKTWLLKYIEKRLVEALGEDIFIIYTNVPESLSSLFEGFIDSIYQQRESFFERVEREVGKTPDEWKDFFQDQELGTAMWNLKYNVHYDVSHQWLKGVTLTAGSLREAGLVSNIKGTKIIDIMIKIFNVITILYSSCVFMVDEIGLVRPLSQARILSSSLRQLLDSFFEKFGLICTYTAHLSDHLIDLGYSEHLYRRFDYECELSPIRDDHITEFIRLHHTVYRDDAEGIVDQLHPFNEESLHFLLSLMESDSHYPGPILHSLGIFALEAANESVGMVDPDFIEAHKSRLPRSYQPRS